MSTFLDKVEEGVNALREELVRLFGDHSSIHNVTSDFKAHILGAAALHFGEETQPSEGEAVPNDSPITDTTKSESGV